MSKINGGGPAFPVPGFIYPNDELQHPDGGMSMRDKFADSVLPAVFKEHMVFIRNNEYRLTENFAKVIAQDAYKLADAMLAARESS